jgi:hypothetical protein
MFQINVGGRNELAYFMLHTDFLRDEWCMGEWIQFVDDSPLECKAMQSGRK